MVLFEENERLKAENDELLEENQNLKVECYNGCDVALENERLRAEIERLEYLLPPEGCNECESTLRERVYYLEGYIKMIKNNEVDDVIREVE